MTAYLNVHYNHFSALQRWVKQAGAAATLDMTDLTMEVKHRGRYFRMYPLFQAKVNGMLVHLPSLSPEVTGFGGWRPYQTITHPHSTDKQLFKQFLADAGLRTPASWPLTESAPECDYVLKASTGSFGKEVFGPYRAMTPIVLPARKRNDQANVFVERFIPGRMLKVWFWGARPFFAHVQSYPTIQGDGRSKAGDLLGRRLAATARDVSSERGLAEGCLAFQSIGLDDVPAAGQVLWFDYRYAQQYETVAGPTPHSDNALEILRSATGQQLEDMGVALADLLRRTIPVPVMITVDGILDDEDRIWWLEMNTNSLLPPEGYETMFADLFA